MLCGNPANRDYGTDSGGDTEDRLFILSNEEVFEGENAGRYGFHASRDYDDPAKRFTSTLYAKCMGSWWSPVDKYAGNSFWFMRTSGYTARSITYICDFGFVYSRGTLATCSDAGVLPALWIDLDKAEIAADGETLSTRIIRTTVREEALLPAEEIGNPVYPPARRMLAAHGITKIDHRARQMDMDDYRYYDRIIVMDGENLWNARRITGGDPDGKVSMLLDRQIDDPWYTDDFQTAYDDILEGCKNLLEELT